MGKKNSILWLEVKGLFANKYSVFFKEKLDWEKDHPKVNVCDIL